MFFFVGTKVTSTFIPFCEYILCMCLPDVWRHFENFQAKEKRNETKENRKFASLSKLVCRVNVSLLSVHLFSFPSPSCRLVSFGKKTNKKQRKRKRNTHQPPITAHRDNPSCTIRNKKRTTAMTTTAYLCVCVFVAYSNGFLYGHLLFWPY